jgi:YfiR/HmsC-like
MALLKPRAPHPARPPRPPRAPAARPRLGAVAALALLAAVLPPATAAVAPPPAAPLEYKVKAAFLFNFAKFVTWPPETFRDPRDPLALCVFGADPFGGDLDAIVAGERLEARPLEVRRVNRLDDLRSCQIAFFSRAEAGRLPEILASLRGSNVLTVGESKRFAEQGGLIRFVLDGKRVRFEVNLDALERTRLTVSSKLLRVAQVVRPDSRGAPH